MHSQRHSDPQGVLDPAVPSSSPIVILHTSGYSRYGCGAAALPPGRAGLEAFLLEYLSPEHRDSPADGCPSAALLDEIGRCATATKDAYTGGTRSILDEIATRLAPGDPRSAYGKAVGIFTMVAGTLQLARALSDPKLSDEVLAHGIENARRS
ncbi:hypothetical protein [Actinoplanes sp. ATCC 53533]|uniref:hypothetical protein n=1 Tax=Actinoplanes sp. ATCC 53533 TaxID=1288362 RepID=UPI0018F4093F|nr:hypothetical protein [Actinoplanes sp. ATCC 53533]